VQQLKLQIDDRRDPERLRVLQGLAGGTGKQIDPALVEPAYDVRIEVD
jgi:hypothetical protein